MDQMPEVLHPHEGFCDSKAWIHRPHLRAIVADDILRPLPQEPCRQRRDSKVPDPLRVQKGPQRNVLVAFPETSERSEGPESPRPSRLGPIDPSSMWMVEYTKSPGETTLYLARSREAIRLSK